MKINGEAFRKMRENLLLSQYHLAKLAGVTPNVVKSIEQGGLPRLQSIRKLLSVLNLTVQEAYQDKLLED